MSFSLYSYTRQDSLRHITFLTFTKHTLREGVYRIFNIQKSRVTVFEVALFRNGSTDFNEIFFVYLVGMRIGRKVFFSLLGPTRGGVQTRVLRFTVKMFVYKQLILVIGEIFSRNYWYLFIIWLPLVNRADQMRVCIKSNFHTLPTWYAVAYCRIAYTREVELCSKGVEQLIFF